MSFVNNSPENDNGFPGTNFGANCNWPTYMNGDETTQLLSDCSLIKEDVPYCKSKGVKVLLSIGGVFGSGSRYDVSTDEKGQEFASFLYSAFGPYQKSWTGPRPFDVSPDSPTSVDGFDFDIEIKDPQYST